MLNTFMFGPAESIGPGHGLHLSSLNRGPAYLALSATHAPGPQEQPRRPHLPSAGLSKHQHGSGGCSPSKLTGLVLPSYKGTSLTVVLSKKTGSFDLSVEDVNSKAPF